MSKTEEEIAAITDDHTPLYDPAIMPCELEPDFRPDPKNCVRCPIDGCKCWVFDTQMYLMSSHLRERHNLFTCQMGCGLCMDTQEAWEMHSECCYKHPNALVNRPLWEAKRQFDHQVIARFAKDGPPDPWPLIRVKNFRDELTCIVKGPEVGVPYNALPCKADCGRPIGAGRRRKALCEGCSIALDTATQALRTLAESSRPTVPGVPENRLETPQEMATKLAEALARIERLEARVTDLELRLKETVE